MISVSNNRLSRIYTAIAIKNYHYLRGTHQLIGKQRDDRLSDLSLYFRDIAELPGDPYNTGFYDFPDPAEYRPDFLRNLLRKNLPSRLTWTKAEKLYNYQGYEDSQIPQTISPFVDKLARFIIAFVAGMSLVVPMLIMAVHTASLKTILVTSIAVFLFAILLALATEASNTETFAATAGYAAVLVIFVGASNTASG
jgi:hypothetical protein